MNDEHELLKVAQRLFLAVKYNNCKCVDLFFFFLLIPQLGSSAVTPAGDNFFPTPCSADSHLAEPFLLVNIKKKKL